MGTKLTILSENSVGHQEGLLGEHGLAIFIEKDGQNILFDTGQGATLIGNASRLGIDLKLIDRIVISHGHWDHVGGLPSVLTLNQRRIPINVHPDAFAERYYTQRSKESQDVSLRDAGIRFSQHYLESFGADFKTNTTPVNLTDALLLTGEVPRITNFEKTAPQLKIRRGDALVADPVTDEQSLVIKGAEGLIIVIGCGHPGIANIMTYAMTLTGIPDIEAVIGGTHLMFLEDDQLAATLSALEHFKPRLIGTSHCTGGKANSLIRMRFPEQFLECNVGTVLEFK